MCDELKRRIIRKAIRSGCDPLAGAYIRYDGLLYFVNIREDIVFRVRERKDEN